MTILATTASTDSGAILIAWGITAAALVVAWLGGRRLPDGVPEGLFVAAVSGLLVLNYVTMLETEPELLQSVILVTLAVVWLAVATWVEREPVPAGDPAAAARRSRRRDLSLHAMAMAGLLAVAVMLSAAGPDYVLTIGLLGALGVLLIVVVALSILMRGPFSRYAVIGVLLTLLWFSVRRSWLDSHRLATALGLLVCGAAALLLVIGTLVADWRRRVRVWRTDPARLTDGNAQHRALYSAVIAACTVVGAGGVLPSSHVVTPLAVLLAAYACLTVGHLWRSGPVGELGLALIAEAIVIAAIVWLPDSPAAALLGVALAGVFMLWLTRFWHQQLDEGQPWTTAGRLIPTARNLGYAAAGLQLVLAALWAVRSESAAMPAAWLAGVALLFMLLHWSMLVRDAATQSSSTAALAAGMVLLAALVPAHGLAHWPALTPGFWLAAAGLGLAIRVGAADARVPIAWVYNAYIGGLLLTAAAYDWALRGVSATGAVPAMLTAGCILAAFWLRWGRQVRPHGLSGATAVL